jgi:photosystem II stability/assembly factor-like uncharacterized protein
MIRFPKFSRRTGALLAFAGLALLAAGCVQDGPLGAGADDAREAPVRLSVAVGRVDGLNAGLGKSAAVSLQRLIVVFTSSALDTIRDTLTTSTTPSISASAATGQLVSKTYSLKALRSWKVVATVKDARDTVTHRDSATTAVVYNLDTLSVPLTLTSRFVGYRASLTIPDSIVSVSGTGTKDQLRVNRIVLKVDGVTKLDSVLPGYFTANTVSTLSFDYVSPGSHTLQVLAYGPLHAWDVTQPLYSGSVSANLAAGGPDTTVTLTMTWQGPTTGVKGITVTLGRGNVVTGSNAFPGTTGLPPAWTPYDITSTTGYNRVVFVSTDGIVVGDDGVILRTSNGGTSWRLEASTTSQHLYGVASQSGGGVTDWAVGDSGTILAYVSSAWVSRAGNAPTTVTLRGFDYKSNTGFAVGSGGTILKSTDINVASPTWTAQTSNTTQTLNAVVVFGTSSAMAVGNGGVCRVYDGSTWATVSTGTTRNLRGLSCQSSSSCTAVGDSGTILTYNGTWSSVSSPTTRNLRDVGQASGTNIIAVGDSGLTMKYNGTAWAVGSSGTIRNLYGVVNQDANHAWAVGAGGTIKLSSDGGASYAGQPLSLADFYGVQFPSTTRGFAVGSGGNVFRYTSSNNRWSYISSGTTSQLNGVFFTDNSTGWAVGAGGVMVKTVNGGNGWTSQTSGTTGDLNGTYFVSGTTGWAVGAAGTITKTANGTSWTSATFGSNAYYGIYMRSSTLGWAVGVSGTIRKTTDGGGTWTAQTSGVTDTLYGVYFLTDNTGWAVGSNGAIRKTTDGGSNWSGLTSNTPNTLRGVQFLDANKGFAVGLGGKILKTTNGGTSWKAQYLGASPQINAVAFGSSTVGWAVGSGGTLMSFNP